MKLPHYFVQTEVEDNDCHHYVCKWEREHQKEKSVYDYHIILECHEDDSINLCNILNSSDPWGELFDDWVGCSSVG